VRILTTLALPDAGRARVAGIDVLARPAAVRRQIGVAAQDATLDGLLAGRQNLVLVGELSGMRTGQARTRALLTACLCALVVVVTGLAVGWRTTAGLLPIIAGFALVLFFAYSPSWVAACVGLNSKSPESAASFGFIVLFPLAFVSNALVPTQHMPGWLQAVADWNPVSAVTAGARQLWDNPNPSASIAAWPMQHPIEASLAWSVLILAVAAPLASWYFRRRTTE